MTGAEARPPLLEVRGVSKAFGGPPVVDAVDLAVGPGELFALLGASGSGKTTLLRLIAGLEQPDRGTVLIDGRDVTAAPPYRRPVNTVFQSYALFPHMNVRANVAFGLKQDGLARGEIEARVEEMLALVQMGDFAARKPHQLSGGQRQRVALARSLAKLPKLLLLDEPMAALDRKLREQTRLELSRIQRRVGIAFVLVTHDQDEAMALADRMAVMEAGRIVQVGTPQAVYDRPATRAIAGFIGDANLFEGAVRGRDGATAAVAMPGGAVLRVGAAAAAPDGPVWIAVRPERLRLGPDAPPGWNAVAATVERVEFLGDGSRVHLRGDDGASLRATLHAGAAPVAAGQRVIASWPPDAGVLLTR